GVGVLLTLGLAEGVGVIEAGTDGGGVGVVPLFPPDVARTMPAAAPTMTSAPTMMATRRPRPGFRGGAPRGMPSAMAGGGGAATAPSATVAGMKPPGGAGGASVGSRVAGGGGG